MHLITIALWLLAFANAQLPTPQNDPFNTSTACIILSRLLPSLVAFPNTKAYNAQNGNYYALQATVLQPACRVAPMKTEDVATALKVLSESRVKFAIKSGYVNLLVPCCLFVYWRLLWWHGKGQETDNK
jgi:hypothetical protein